MNLKRLLKLKLGEAISIFREPFIHIGHALIELDGGEKIRWLFDDEGQLLSIAPQEEEFLLLEEVDEELEPEEEEVVLFHGKEFEFNYEDAGTVIEVDGESVIEEDDRFMFSDYHAADGEILRFIEDEHTGERSAYIGRHVLEDDIAEL